MFDSAAEKQVSLAHLRHISSVPCLPFTTEQEGFVAADVAVFEN
jgi:hypothetical protein